MKSQNSLCSPVFARVLFRRQDHSINAVLILTFWQKKWTIQMVKVNIIQTSKIEFNQFSDMKRKVLWRWIQVCFAQTKSVMEYFTPKTMFINSSLLLIYLLLVRPGKKHQQRLKPWMFMSWTFNRVSCFKWYGQRFHFIYHCKKTKEGSTLKNVNIGFLENSTIYRQWEKNEHERKVVLWIGLSCLFSRPNTLKALWAYNTISQCI